MTNHSNLALFWITGHTGTPGNIIRDEHSRSETASENRSTSRLLQVKLSTGITGGYADQIVEQTAEILRHWYPHQEIEFLIQRLL